MTESLENKIMEAAGRDSIGLGIAKKFNEDPFGYNPITARMISEGYQGIPESEERGLFEEAQHSPIEQREKDVKNLTAYNKTEVATLVSNNLNDSVGLLDSRGIAAYLINRKPTNKPEGEFGRLYDSAVKAQKLIQELNSEESPSKETLEKAVKMYVEKLDKEYSSAGRSKAGLNFVKFALSRQPGIALRAAQRKAIEDLETYQSFVDQNVGLAKSYLLKEYMVAEKNQSEEAYNLGKFVAQFIAKKQAEEAEKKSKKKAA